MDDSVAYECGVDIDSSFQFRDGDLLLSEYDENLVQAVINRLNTNLEELDLFYEDYGSIFTSFLGWRTTDETKEYMKTEIATVLRKEPRLSSFDINLEYTDIGTLKINLDLYTTDGSILESNLVLGAEGIVEVETTEDEFDNEVEEM